MIYSQSVANLYIHLPFCRSRCHYCSFPSVAVDKIPEKLYLVALKAEFEYRFKSWPQNSLPLVSLYFGGGTPSLFSPSFYSRIIDFFAEKLVFSDSPEITLEANPADISLEKIRGYRAAGINRISLGAQTFAAEGLQLLGRRHDGLMVENAVSILRQGGIDNLSLDLIYAWPGQNRAGLIEDLIKLRHLSPEHVSTYSLSLEPQTQLAQALSSGELQAVSDDLQAEMMALVGDHLQGYGLFRYEVSNFARSHNLQAQHNLAYWQLHDFLGLGAGACGGWRCRKSQKHWAQRYCNITDPFSYMVKLNEFNPSSCTPDFNSEVSSNSWFEVEIIDRKTSFSEALMMGLRLRQGVALAPLRADYGSQSVAAVTSKAQPLQVEGLLDWDENNLWITDKGLFLSDTILSFLL